MQYHNPVELLIYYYVDCTVMMISSRISAELSNKDAKVVEHERELLELQKMVDQKDAFLREKQGEIEQLEGEKTRRVSSAWEAQRFCALTVFAIELYTTNRQALVGVAETRL